MLRPRKMKFMELTVLKTDIDSVLEYLGKKAVMQFGEAEEMPENQDAVRIRNIIERLYNAGKYAGIELNAAIDDNISGPGKDAEAQSEILCSAIEKLKENERKTFLEKQHIRETINETKAFAKMNVPFSDFEHLSYLTLRIGRLDPRGLNELRENMGNRAVIIPLDENRFLAACSKKGRFALDSQLKKVSYEPVKVPDNYMGIPSEMIGNLNAQYQSLEKKIAEIKTEKEEIRGKYASDLKSLVSSWRIALVMEEIKARFLTTDSLYHFSGWTPADMVQTLTKDLSQITGGRIAIHVLSPEEVPSIKSGKEKVPVAMKHSAFVKGFEGVVFSYGAPLYGTIDPTPLVAFFFTLMFGIMFGDAGQGFVLLLAGILTGKSKKMFSGFKKYSIPLISVGIASMVMGMLAGSVFTNELLLVAPTRAVTGAIFGKPMDRILHILPMAGAGGSITKLLYFFAFTIAIGVIVNSLGLIINIFNRCTLKKYQAAFFSKTGLAGLFLFWYALFIAIKLIMGGSFEAYDFAGLFTPLFFIFFGHVIWRLIAKEKPVLENGLLAFVMEGFVEVMETVSTFFSNTVSFLRIGAFALAHAVFSFIVFYFTEVLAHSGVAGTLSAALIMITGNAIIIVLEGLIVAIQVIRLQYYEFFNKFFVETGVEFAPFRFKNKE